MKKVLFGITSLGLGGAERVLVDLTNRLSDEYDITILTIYPNGELEKQLTDKVKIISLYSKPFSTYNKLQKLMISLKLLFIDKPPKGYDTYISFLEGPATRLIAKIKDNNKIVWIHNDISKVFGNNLKAKIKKVLDKKIYNKYDKLVFVSEENRQDFNKFYGNETENDFNSKKDKHSNNENQVLEDEDYNNQNQIVIRNYLDYNKVLEKAEEEVELPYDKSNVNLLSVCRLVEQKAIDRFIKIHASLENEGIHSKVYIIGDGPERKKLEEEIKELKEEDNFFLLGAKENPYPYIKNANYFCLLSNYEGYGMVLDEAKILNKSIIITDTASRESLENYNNGIILENTEKGIYKGLKKTLISDIIITDFDEKERKEETKRYYDNIILEIKSIIN